MTLLNRKPNFTSQDHSFLTSHPAILQYRRPGMCQHTVLNDGKGNSKKGKLPTTVQQRSCFHGRKALIYVASVTSIVYYMYSKVLQKFKFFIGVQCNSICKIVSKSGQKGEFGHYTLNISVYRPCKFIFELG